MAGKLFFGLLVLVLIGGLLFATMYKPPAGDAPKATGFPAQTRVANDLPRAANITPTTAPVGIEVGNRAPGWSFRDADGNMHSLDDYLGQVVVMDFWATWCGPCKMIMPDLQKFHEQYQSRGVVVIGMNGSERGADPAKFMRDNRYTYQLLVKTDPAMGQYARNGIPQVYVVGVDGTILHKHIGAVSGLDKQLANVVEPHLKKHGL